MHARVEAAGRSRPALWLQNWRRRKQYIVDWDVQLRLVRQFLGFVLLATALGAYLLHVLFWVHEAYVSGPLSDPHTHWTEWLLAWGFAVFSVVVSIGIFLLLGLFYSHRIAGPARKLTAALTEMADKGLERPVKLRETDYLKEVARAVNQVDRTWARTLSRIEQALAPLRDSAGGVSPEVLERQVAEIDGAIARFRAPVKPAQVPPPPA
jgi:methyl-accepting chemotaxis protein